MNRVLSSCTKKNGCCYWPKRSPPCGILRPAVKRAIFSRCESSVINLLAESAPDRAVMVQWYRKRRRNAPAAFGDEALFGVGCVLPDHMGWHGSPPARGAMCSSCVCRMRPLMYSSRGEESPQCESSFPRGSTYRARALPACLSLQSIYLRNQSVHTNVMRRRYTIHSVAQSALRFSTVRHDHDQWDRRTQNEAADAGQ